MPELDYDHYLRMAQHMKASNDEIIAAILQVEKAKHGVVALVFTNQGHDMELQILDEPFDDNVRVFPGD